MLTNWKTIQGSIKRLKQMEERSAATSRASPRRRS
jgi:ribosomal protein S2